MLIDLIKYPVITEKYVATISKNGQQTYAFDLDVRLTKPLIKKLLEEIFKVNIVSVNTYLAPIKKKRIGSKQGYKTRYKRAIVKLRPNEKIIISSDKEANKESKSKE